MGNYIVTIVDNNFGQAHVVSILARDGVNVISDADESQCMLLGQPGFDRLLVLDILVSAWEKFLRCFLVASVLIEPPSS